MGNRLQARRDDLERRTLRRLTSAYLAVFASVILALSVVAYAAIAANYRTILAPALETPEGRAGLSAALRPALFAIVSVDAALLLGVGAASYALARAALRPLVTAREREERFAADIAHELRTPLAAIASLAQSDPEPNARETERTLAAIARRAIECGELIGDLLTLARASDREALEREPIDLAVVVGRACRDLPERLRSVVAIDISLDSVIVQGDERRLLQLARNLTWNAVAHARSRAVVRVYCDRGAAFITVEDDGPGVSPDVEPRLFERFAKGAGSSGSGLGLAICRWVARAHGGDVTYSGGSRFTARFPLYTGGSGVF